MNKGFNPTSMAMSLSADEVAHLIAGGDEWAHIAYEWLKQSYLTTAVCCCFGNPDPVPASFFDDYLMGAPISVELWRLIEKAKKTNDPWPLRFWWESPAAAFELQTFHPDVIGRWLARTGKGAATDFGQHEYAVLRPWLPPTARPEPLEEELPAPEPTAPQQQGPKLKRKALISEYSKQWPSIEADLNEASRNGLAEAARADGYGLWFVGLALQWAKERGKLQQTAPQAPATWFPQ